MKKTHDKRSSMLNERLMKKWGYNPSESEEEEIQEGILDRAIGNVKSFASGVTDPLSRVSKALKGQSVPATEPREVRKQRVKFQSLLKGKLNKIKSLKKDLESDMITMNIDLSGKSAKAALGLMEITVDALQQILDGETELFEPEQPTTQEPGKNNEEEWGLPPDADKYAREQFEFEKREREKQEDVIDAEWT
jgi:hypothetical protein